MFKEIFTLFVILLAFITMSGASQQQKVQADDGKNLSLIYSEETPAGTLYCYGDKTIQWTSVGRVYVLRGNNGSGSVSVMAK